LLRRAYSRAPSHGLTADWCSEELRIQMAIAGLEEAKNGDRLLNVQRIIELANKAYFLLDRRCKV
jgi:hypothetical protein